MNRAERRALAKQISRGGVDMAPQPETKRPVISLGFCTDGSLTFLWHESVLHFISAASRIGVGVREVPVETGPFLSSARNIIVSRALVHEDDYLLMTDTDIAFRPEDVNLLLEADAAIAGAHYLTAATGEPPRAVALVERGEEAVGSKNYEPITLPELPFPPDPADFEDVKDYEAAAAMYIAELREDHQNRTVAAVGCGLMLIKREVLVAMAEKFDHPFEYVGNVGEDVTFCLRAASLGFETVLVPQARVGHIKKVVL